jgi:hypothetical protein
MAATTAGYGPLAPHMLSEIPKRRVGSIGYESPIKRICILPARRRYKFQKHSDGEARFMSSSPHHRSILWALYRLVAGKMHICLLGALSPINQTQCTGIFDNICGARGPFPAAASMVVLLVVFLRQVGKSTTSSVRGRPKYLDE